MATNVTSLSVKNTLAVGGLATLASVLITTATITTLGVTTANITTANVQTLSGATINAVQANGKVVTKTLSGTNLKLNGTQAQGALCHQTGGTIGACSTAINAVGDCTCGAL